MEESVAGQRGAGGRLPILVGQLTERAPGCAKLPEGHLPGLEKGITKGGGRWTQETITKYKGKGQGLPIFVEQALGAFTWFRSGTTCPMDLWDRRSSKKLFRLTGAFLPAAGARAQHVPADAGARGRAGCFVLPGRRHSQN